MDRVIHIANKIFFDLFVGTSASQPYRGLIPRILSHILYSPYFYLGAIFLIIGFSVGILKRIIHS